MEVLELEEFIDYYKDKGELPFPMVTPKVKMSEAQLKSKYRDYLNKVDKSSTKKQTTFAQALHPEESKSKKSTYAKAVEDAMNAFREKNDRSPFMNYFNKLSPSQRKVIESELWMCPINPETKIQTWDVAHIIGRGENQKLADKDFNYILLPRNFHSHLDFMENPLTPQHERISKEQHDQIWIDLIGKEKWDFLVNYER